MVFSVGLCVEMTVDSGSSSKCVLIAFFVRALFDHLFPISVLVESVSTMKQVQLNDYLGYNPSDYHAYEADAVISLIYSV